MSNKRPKGTFLTTPKGPAIWPSLNAPDTKWDPEGKYTCKQKFAGDDPEVQALVARLTKIRDDFYDAEIERLKAEKKMALARELKKGDVIKVELDDETGDETGFLILGSSMKASGTTKDGRPWSQKPKLFNAKGIELKAPPRISSGTIVKLSVEVSPFVAQSNKEVTLSIRLHAAQIISLVSGGSRSFEGYGFASEDGDEIGDEDQGSPFGDEGDADYSSSEHDDL